MKTIFENIWKNQRDKAGGIREKGEGEGTASVWPELHIRFQFNIRFRFKILTRDDRMREFCSL
jgi:hypothetical protein